MWLFVVEMYTATSRILYDNKIIEISIKTQTKPRKQIIIICDKVKYVKQWETCEILF